MAEPLMCKGLCPGATPPLRSKVSSTRSDLGTKVHAAACSEAPLGDLGRPLADWWVGCGNNKLCSFALTAEDGVT